MNDSQQLNNWLPITASRKAKWWYSAFHNVTAMVGAGVLGLPLVLARLGWVPGVIAIAVSWLVTWYTVWQLIQLHETEAGKRFDRFTELGEHAFGRKGTWIVLPQQLVVQVGSNIVYMVTGGKSLKKCFGSMSHEADFRKTYYILIFTFIQLILSQVPNFNSLKIISIAAAVMSLSYSMIATGASVVKGISHHHVVQYSLRSHTTSGIVFDIFSSLGVLAFAFAGHSVALEIQATIPSTPENPSKKPMWRGVVVAYLIVALCYFPVAISGYWAFGNVVEDDVLLSLEKPKWLISVANFMVFIHVVGSYQVFAMPVFDKIESALVRKWQYAPGRPLRLVARSTYVGNFLNSMFVESITSVSVNISAGTIEIHNNVESAANVSVNISTDTIEIHNIFTGFMAMLLPFFGGLLGFFGGLAFAATSYIIPSICWLKVKQPQIWSIHWIACWVSISIGVVIMALAPIGGAHEIVVSWKNLTLFS